MSPRADAIGIKADAAIGPIGTKAGARTELPKIKYKSVMRIMSMEETRILILKIKKKQNCQSTATTITTVKLSQQPQQQEIQ
ncbi:hypothetical protein Glove_217g258 [Diversispora epigaea]|uniref:Uncharacterized protein n=1 Tax=Diversispora epigaea TaxID=1348612 RepID=A0A397IN79_9GLOM|nr:hypothetical protein Glove_217g258 [Diversispora epigaea]